AQRKKWGFANDDFIICFGSSRPGEEALLMSIFTRLKNAIPHLKIILAPRHPKRINEVLELMSGRDVSLLSALDGATTQSRDLLLIDQLGFLDQAYSICDVAIVGGSFYDFGGHNPLEPAFYSKPVIMGIHHHSCQDSVRQLQSRDAILICAKEKLAENLIRLYKNADLRTSMGQNAKSILTDNASALDNHLRGIEKWIT
ncbi:MAG: 3-deoxy-D-manno-octulosonic acid transferase, partial [Candidatus Cloacimonadaceae bacterium]|nr:3-deoxy-D-manno-octulosonic acid transferase [Candidatus Cloacimonadaceae bacterium]